jgi:hypothetical protein
LILFLDWSLVGCRPPHPYLYPYPYPYPYLPPPPPVSNVTGPDNSPSHLGDGNKTPTPLGPARLTPSTNTTASVPYPHLPVLPPVNNAIGSASYHQMMDRYLDFDTNALDLATAVQPPVAGSSFASSSHSGSSPQAPYSATSEQKQSMHSYAPHSSSSSTQKHPFQSPTPSPHHPNDSHSAAHFQNLFNGDNSMSGMVSMDDSTIPQSTYPSQTHQSKNPQRESFSYGTTGTAQPMSPSTMIPLNRVQSAGSAGDSSSWQPNGGDRAFPEAGSAGNSRDGTMSVRNPKRSSWALLRSLAGSS